MANNNLHTAKVSKNDEFYTQYHDIEKEMNSYLEYNPQAFEGKTILLPCDDPEWSNFTKYFAQNFERFGLKKLISTSYAADSKLYDSNYQPSLFETEDPKFDQTKTNINGKIFTLTKDNDKNGKIDFDDIEWNYLEGSGDFRSDEIKKIRDEADIIITNPPFSLFRDFLSWIVEAEKQFVIVGNMNAITYKEVFPLIKENKIWLGVKSTSQAMFFKTSNKEYASRVSSERPEGSFWRTFDGEVCIGINNSCWFTNLDHGRRHQPIPLMTLTDNRKFNSKVIKSETCYKKYDNYDAIEIPFTNAIPSDYEGIMGVPISFLDKYNPEQFDLVGSNRGVDQDENGVYGQSTYLNSKETFKRIFIKHKKQLN